MPGLFISFEGGEGSGKTTQINRTAQILAEQGHKIITTREPGGTPEAEKIRALLVQREGGNWSPMSEALLLFAARSLHTRDVIAPALVSNKIVISDRYTDSTRAYQGYGHGLDLKIIENLNQTVLQNFAPHLTFILDIDPEIGLARSNRRLAGEKFMGAQSEDRFEKLDLEFHKKLRQGFVEIANKNPERCHLLNANDTPENITTQILSIIQKRL